MKKLIASVLFSCVWVGPALADSPKAQSKDPADAVEQGMGKAMLAGDIGKLNGRVS